MEITELSEMIVDSHDVPDIIGHDNAASPPPKTKGLLRSVERQRAHDGRRGAGHEQFVSPVRPLALKVLIAQQQRWLDPVDCAGRVERGAVDG
ncbi:MAG: hypothetical protein WB615_08400 [Candidatus Tumulicola sp.]